MTGYLGTLSKRPEDHVGSIAQNEREAMWGEIPGKVIAFYPEKQTADIEPQFRPRINGKPAEMPTLYDMPVRFPRVGGFVITTPVKVGDVLTLRPQMRSSERYHTEGVYEASDSRSASLADYEAFLDGGEPLTDPITGFNPDNFEIRSADGQFAIEMSEDGKFRFRGAQGNFIALLAEAVAKAAEGFTKLGTEPDLVHTATYTSVGAELTTIAGKLDGMSIE